MPGEVRGKKLFCRTPAQPIAGSGVNTQKALKPDIENPCKRAVFVLFPSCAGAADSRLGDAGRAKWTKAGQLREKNGNLDRHQTLDCGEMWRRL